MSEVFGNVPEHLAVTFVGILILEEAVQERGVHRIDADFERLQPVAIDHALEGEGVGARRNEAVKIRKCRRLAGAEIGPDDAALLDHRIGFLFQVGAQIAVVGLGRRLQALAVDVEQPAMKRAAQPAVFEPPVSEIGAAMWTMAADQPVAPLVVLEGDEVLAEQPHRLHRPVAGQFIDQRGRLPIAPHQCAGVGFRPRASNEIVLFRAQHRSLPCCNDYPTPVSRARRSTKWCAAEPGSPQISRLRRSRISNAPLRAALHPGNADHLSDFEYHRDGRFKTPAAPVLSGSQAT